MNQIIERAVSSLYLSNAYLEDILKLDVNGLFSESFSSVNKTVIFLQSFTAGFIADTLGKREFTRDFSLVTTDHIIRQVYNIKLGKKQITSIIDDIGKNELELFARWNLKGGISARLFNIDVGKLAINKGVGVLFDLETVVWMNKHMKYNPMKEQDYVFNLYNQCQPKSELPVKYNVDCLKEIINVSSIPF